MLTGGASRLVETNAANTGHSGRVWRPFPAELSELLCLESPTGGVGPWMHGRFAITLVRSRAIVRLESRRSVQVEGGTLLLVPPVHAYAVRPVGAARPSAVTLLFASSALERVDQGNLPAIVARPELTESAVQLVSELARPVRAVDRASEAASLLRALMAENAAVAPARTSCAATPLLPLRDYLRAHLGEPVSTATLARISGLTESHCIRAFHHEFGLPPHAYQIRLRLAQACDLLARGESVSTAAYDCGFADQSHLTRKFKSGYGVAPGEWASAAGRGMVRATSPLTARRFARTPASEAYA